MEKRGLINYLLIKTHNITGLKYLCFTTKENWHDYRGSGKYWKSHLKTHGTNFDTKLIYQNSNYEEFVEYARNLSISLNIVESKEWANLKLEEGDGGSTTSKTRWITDGVINKLITQYDTIPTGWYYGRKNTHFSNSMMQSSFSKSNTGDRSAALKKAWIKTRDTRDHSKCGTKGDKNPAKRIDIKTKISDGIKLAYSTKKPCYLCDRVYFNIKSHIVKSHDN